MAPKIFTALPGRDGAFFGHFIPAFFYFCFSTFFLLLSLKRAIRLRLLENNNKQSPSPTQQQQSTSFAELHIPEQNCFLLLCMSLILVGTTSVGLLEEIGTQIYDPGFHPLTHQAVYISFMIVGLIGILESRQFLPADSIRMVMTIAFIGQAMMFADHAKEKVTKTDESLHMYVSYVSWANAIMLMYSIHDPTSVRAYVASWALMLLQSTWFTTVALYASFINMEAQFVGTWLSLQAMIIVLLIGVTIGYCLPVNPNNTAITPPTCTNRGGDFTKLITKDLDEHHQLPNDIDIYTTDNV